MIVWIISSLVDLLLVASVGVIWIMLSNEKDRLGRTEVWLSRVDREIHIHKAIIQGEADIVALSDGEILTFRQWHYVKYGCWPYEGDVPLSVGLEHMQNATSDYLAYLTDRLR